MSSVGDKKYYRLVILTLSQAAHGRPGGWRLWRIQALWLAIVLLSALAALVGFTFFDTASPDVLAFTMAFAGGALLTMLADSMMPEAFRDSGKLVGLVTTLGFGLAYLISATS